MSFDPTNKPYQISVAPEAVEVGEDYLVFPGGVLLPLSARGSGVPGMPDRPWSRLTADTFYTNLPTIYSLALRREPPDVLRGSLRAKRTLFEGFMLAMAEKTGRRLCWLLWSSAQNCATKRVEGRVSYCSTQISGI